MPLYKRLNHYNIYFFEKQPQNVTKIRYNVTISEWYALAHFVVGGNSGYLSFVKKCMPHRIMPFENTDG